MKKEKKDNETASKKAGLAAAKGKTKKPPKPPRKKRKKLLKTPSHIIRLVMVWTYVILIFLLSMPFMTTTLYIRDDLSIGSDLSSATLRYADQAQIDQAAEELQKALDSLKKNGEAVPESSSDVAVSSATFDWSYHITTGVNIDKIMPLITKSKELNRNEYTEASVKAVNEATLKAQHLLCATVTISQSALQIVLGGALNDLPSEDVGGIIVSGIMMFALAILPVVGFFIATFDKRSHVKNVYTAICSPVCIAMIFFAVYPTIGLGAVISVILYILLFALTAGDIYAIQQERYIMRHPELEAEFTEKHPQFVKALINYKAVALKDSIEEQEELERKAEKRKNKKARK